MGLVTTGTKASGFYLLAQAMRRRHRAALKEGDDLKLFEKKKRKEDPS